jgi:hypothetical protein
VLADLDTHEVVVAPVNDVRNAEQTVVGDLLGFPAAEATALERADVVATTPTRAA